jgi:hypothetical protein
VQQVAVENNLKPAHANWLEAFPFTIVDDLPNADKIPPKVIGLLSADATRKVYGDGVFGGEYAVDPLIMDHIFSAALSDILNLLDFD